MLFAILKYFENNIVNYYSKQLLLKAKSATNIGKFLNVSYNSLY